MAQNIVWLDQIRSEQMFGKHGTLFEKRALDYGAH